MSKWPREKDVQQIAKKLDLSPAAVYRLLGSVSIPADAERRSSESFDLGLRLRSIEFFPDQSDELVSCVSEVLREYRRVCPAVFRWLMRGDFSVRTRPIEVGRGLLLHASRTSGRLRAQVLRDVQTSTTSYMS